MLVKNEMRWWMKADFIVFQFLLVNYKLMKVEGHVADTFGLCRSIYCFDGYQTKSHDSCEAFLLACKAMSRTMCWWSLWIMEAFSFRTRNLRSFMEESRRTAVNTSRTCRRHIDACFCRCYCIYIYLCYMERFLDSSRGTSCQTSLLFSCF